MGKKLELLRLRDFAGEVQCAEEGKEVSAVQILRAGNFDHPFYGVMLITNTVLSDMVRNFSENVRRQDLAVDYFHESDKEAAGWFTELYLSDDGKELWGKVKWTPRAQKMIRDKEVRYFSADFAFEWTDPESGVAYKNVLFGGGLVNRPFVKDMQPVVELSEGNIQMKTVEQLQNEIKTLGEQHAEEIRKLGETVKAKDGEISELKGKVATLNKAKEDADHEAIFNKMLGEGKACAAQKAAWMDRDMVKFAEGHQPTNLAPKGAEGGGEQKNGAQLSEADEIVRKKLGLTVEEWQKYNQ